MLSAVINSYRKLGILKIYYFSIFFYFLPFFSLLLFLIDQLTLNQTEMLFFVGFLVGLIPCGLLGLTLSIIGLINSAKGKNRLNKIIGAIGTFAGIICLAGGIIGMMLIYVVVAA